MKICYLLLPINYLDINWIIVHLLTKLVYISDNKSSKQMIHPNVWNHYMDKVWVTLIDLRMHHAIMIQITWTPASCYLYHFQIFGKLDSFLKKVLNIFYSKKGRLNLIRTVYLSLVVFSVAFFFLFCRFHQKIEASWRNYWRDWSRTQQIEYTECTWFSF